VKEESDMDFYCSLWKNPAKKCGILHFTKKCVSGANGRKKCEHLRRRHPTPEQFKEEYGKDYPEDGAVYCYTRLAFSDPAPGWLIGAYAWAKNRREGDPIVCACTPFGKPDKDWRPE